jgi:putative protease
MSIELLSPAGNLEKLKFAVYYGADAVYFSYQEFGLRSGAANFTISDIGDAIDFLHKKNKKGYVTLNIYARNEDFKNLENLIYALDEINIDAFIVSDPGVIHFINKLGVKKPLHLSTQANTTNINAVKFWEDCGIQRIILARELSLKEVEYICKNTSVEIEVFIHGAMCVSYSGRCYLSHYMTKRDANRGECSHPCRWKYYLVEETRQGEFFEIEEDRYGSYILNSKDLCLIDYIGKLKNIGVNALKIEGRMKSIFYTSIVTATYRQVLDALAIDGKICQSADKYKEILSMVSNRGYTTGFIDGNYSDSININSSKYIRGADFIGYLEKEEDNVILHCRAKAESFEELHLFMPNLEERTFKLENPEHYRSREKVFVLKPNEKYIVRLPIEVEDFSLVVRKRNGK